MNAYAQAGARLPDVPLPPHRSNQIFCPLIYKMVDYPTILNTLYDCRIQYLMIINEGHSIDLLLFFLPDEKEPKNPVHPIANAQADARLPDVPLPPHRSNQVFCPLIYKTQKPGL